MAYAYAFSATHRFVIIRGTGPQWTGGDILDSAQEIVDEADFASDYDWIYDIRFVHNTVITVDEMERILERFRTLRELGRVDPDSRSVIVTTDQDVQISGALYQYKAGRSDDKFKIVGTIEKAREWLGIEAPASEIKATD